jgi:putative flavoprotein involved in K+ transport
MHTSRLPASRRRPPSRSRTIRGFPRESGARLDLDAENITSIIWATGYSLDFSFLDIPVLDEWNYPRHSQGVTEIPGLYAVGLPWLTRHASATLGLVGDDAQYVVEHLVQRGA